MMLGIREGKSLLGFIKTLPKYLLAQEWSRENLAVRLKWLILPAKDDTSPEAGEIREFIGGYRADEWSFLPTIYLNREPWSSMIRMGSCFDTFLELCLRANIHPFEELPAQIPNLSKHVYGRWVGGLSMPSKSIQDHITRVLAERLGTHDIHVWSWLSDLGCMARGYLTDRHIAEEERNAWRGDRTKAGGDSSLAITNLSAGFPLFRYSKKDFRIGFWGEINYTADLGDDTAKYVRRCHLFGKKRFEMLKSVKRYAGYAEKFVGATTSAAQFDAGAGK